MHRIASKCLEEMAHHDEGQIEIDVAMAIFHEVLRQDDVDRTCHVCDSEDYRPDPDGPRDYLCGSCGTSSWSEIFALPVEQVADLRMETIKWAKDQRFNIENLVSIEERLGCTVYYPSEFGTVPRVLTGQLDALFASGDHGVCLDWKSSWGLPPESGVSFRGYFQQRFYGMLVMRNYPSLSRVTLREVYHRWNEYREVTLHREELGEVEAEMSALVERFDRSVETGIARPSPSKACSYCIRPQACPVDPEARGQGRIEDDTMARRTAAEVVKAKAISKQGTEALKVYADRTGRPIPVADAKGTTHMGFVKTTTRLKPDREAVEAALRAAGEDPGKVEWAKLYRERKGTTFKAYTPEDALAPTAEDQRIAEQMRAAVDALPPAA